MAPTRVEMVSLIADQIGYPKNKSSEIMETLLELIEKALESGDDILISDHQQGGPDTSRGHLGCLSAGDR